MVRAAILLLGPVLDAKAPRGAAIELRFTLQPWPDLPWCKVCERFT